MLQPGFAWKWDTHSNIVDKIYSSMPFAIKKNLVLSAMRDGSNDPDEKFHDTRAHSFPSSYSRANTWLDKGAYAYKARNYQLASYSFGVASHYISDSYSAPHCVSGESNYQHSKYEGQGNSMFPTLTYSSTSLYSSMSSGKTLGSADWNSWMNTKSPSIVQKDLNRGASASFSAIRKKIA
jgi:hypothetical protein